MKLLLILLLLSISYSQRTIIVNTTKDNTPASQLEMELIKNVVKLYNLDHKIKIDFKIVDIKKFADLFAVLEQSKDPNNILSVYQITITEARKKKYLFSSPYLPIKESVYTLTSNNDLNYKKQGTIIAFQTNSTAEFQIKQLNKFGIESIGANSVGEKMKFLREKKASFVIGDNIEIWGNSTYKLVEDCAVQPGSGFGLVYPLKSQLRDELEPYLERYLKSKTYYNFLFKKYGKDVAKYYRENMKFTQK